jgi:hypothetical protein
MIRDLMDAGRYTLGSHAVRHRHQQGFSLVDIIAAVRTGIIIEHYAERARCLICARVRSVAGREIWLHVVVAYHNRGQVHIVTAYRPDPSEWGDPPVRRR